MKGSEKQFRQVSAAREVQRRKASRLGLKPELCDRDALRVVSELQGAQFESYIVGGGIRDLLLGKEPKDFDVVTAARPEQVREIFGRSSRIIGKRFLLAHVSRNRKIVEVATFRSGAASKNSKAGNENIFGNLKEDIQRRDFTVNAMYYDPFSDVLACHEKALSDLKTMRLRTIGNPQERFVEDPVRMLRAARFVAALNFKMATKDAVALERNTKSLKCVSPNRLWSECQKLFLSGNGLKTFATLTEFGLFAELSPQTHKLFTQEKYDCRYKLFLQKLLADTDRRVKEGERAALFFVFLGLLWLTIKYRFRKTCNQLPDTLPRAAKDVLAKQNETVRLSKQVSWTIEKIFLLAWKMENNKILTRRAKNSLKPKHFRAANDLLTLSELAGISVKNSANTRATRAS